jgi:nucleoside-diphosphate-sugar epimerase
MRVLVSGATGSVGSEILKHLAEFDTIKLRHGTGLDADQKEKLAHCDVFIHCGALLNGSFPELLRSNTLLVGDLLEYFSTANPLAHLVLLSSMSMLKPSRNVSHDDFLDFRNMTDYAVSKYMAEIMCSRYSNPITCLRFSTLFCRDPKKDGLSKLIHDAVVKRRVTLLNDGEARRDFLPLGVASQYVARVIGNKKCFGRRMNIVSGEAVSFRQMSDFISSKVCDLVVDRETVKETRSVPCEFNTDDIGLIGKIEFDLFREVESYLEELMKSPRLP